MRQRKLKPDFFFDERVCECPFGARVMLLFLWMMGNQKGRVKKYDAIVAGSTFPLVHGVDFPSSVKALESVGLIEIGPGFIQVKDWDFWQPGCRPDRPGIPERIRLAVFARDGAACLLCNSQKRLSLDHIVPYSKGGPDTIENLRVLCLRCNIKRGNRG